MNSMNNSPNSFLLKNKANEIRYAAIIRQVWQLSYEEKKELNHYFLLTSSSKQLLLNIDCLEEEIMKAPRLYIRHNQWQFSCHLIQLTFDQLTDEPDQQLLISCRVHYASDTWCCVVRKAEDRLIINKTGTVEVAQLKAPAKSTYRKQIK